MGALAAPQQGVSWSYSDLSKRANGVAASLLQRGYKADDILLMDLPNSAENFLLQVACSRIGVACATAKDMKVVGALEGVGRVAGVVTHTAEGATQIMKDYNGPVPKVVLESLDGTLGELASDGSTDGVQADGAAALGYWSSKKPLTNKEALDVQGVDAKQKLNVTADD